MSNRFGSRFAGSLRLWLALLCALSGLATAQLASPPAHSQVRASARTLHVATTGGDSSSCGAVSAPCRTIHRAADLAASGDTILVAAGTYTYNASVDTCSFLTTRAVACFVDKDLTILGGYSTSNWSSADPLSNLTVIDGQNTRRGVAVVAYNRAASLRMEGFTIQNGLAQGAASGGDFFTYAYGGGIWAQNGSLTLRDMVFRNNRAIGGNLGSGYGGGGAGGAVTIAATRGGAPSLLERIRFEGNQALGGTGPERGGLALGGGLFVYQATMTGYALSFDGNRAQAANSGGAGSSAGLLADGLGGAAAFNESTATLYGATALRNQAIGGNATASAGGGYGGGFYAEDSTLNLFQSMVRDNTVQGGVARAGGVAFGGGVLTFNASATLDRVQLLANGATGGSSNVGGAAGPPQGGGMAALTVSGSRSLAVTNSIFGDNRVTAGNGTNSGGGGSGLVVQGMTASVNHSTFARNVLGPGLTVGQAILLQPALSGSMPTVANISYSIIAEHTGSGNASTLHVGSTATANLNRGLFAGNTKNTNSDNLPLPVGTINGQNTMLSAASADFVGPGNYHITAASPAKDQATGSALRVDIDGHGRPVGQTADIGADEYILLNRLAHLPRVTR